jgi:hypothetical protein
LDTVGEIPWAIVRPESGQDKQPCEEKSVVLNVSAEFANSISNGTENRRKGLEASQRQRGHTPTGMASGK